MTETTQLGLPIYSDNDVPLWTNTNDGFEALDSLVNSCSSVKLNWSTPLHQFTAGNLTYTATKDCWLVGNHGETAVGTLKINDNIITQANSGFAYFIPPLSLRKGDVVTVQAPENQLYVLEGELVSGNTYVFNEAQVTLDYAHPLYHFTTSDTSYTATKDCWLVGCIGGGNFPELKINGTTIVKAYYSPSVYLTQIPIYLKLAKGDVVTCNSADNIVSHLNVFDGTVTGSVSALHSNIPDYSNCIAEITPTTTSSYTATQECIMEVTYFASMATNGYVSVNGHRVIGSIGEQGLYSGASKTLHLQMGDVVTWTNSGSASTISVFGLL